MSAPQPTMQEPVRIPLPPEFPIDWADAGLEMVPWQQDRQHLPEPVTPMSAWWAEHFAVGFSAGLAAYSVPLKVRTARLNTYYFMAQVPNVPPEQMPAMEARAAELLPPGVGTFWSRWESEWLPELKRTWNDWSAVDVQGADDASLRRHVDRAIEIYERAWTIHFELLIPAFVGISSFQDLYADLFPGRGALDAYSLLRGGDNMSLETGRKLWELSRIAKADPTLREVFETSASREIPARFEASPSGREFMTRLRDFLSFYGMRSDTVQELADPSWIEDPRPALDNLKAYIRQDEDPDVAHLHLAAERDRLIAEARDAIKGYPEAIRGQFEFLLAAGQFASRVQEDHNFWIDQRCLHETRQLCLDVGRRLDDRQQINEPGDIFMLSMDEALDLLASGRDATSLVASRRAEMDRWRKVTPPPMVGTDYGPPPENPLTRAIFRFFGGPPQAHDSASELRGNAGSPGTVTGVARVILNLQDGGRLEQGEILVTPTTSPPWTPLFATAGGIVTDTGGALSHCAIVAREYGIPAVVGAAGATAMIRDGCTIEVDGDAGLVRIIS